MGGFAASRVLEVHGERILKRNFKPGFRAGLYNKDLGIAMEDRPDAPGAGAGERRCRAAGRCDGGRLAGGTTTTRVWPGCCSTWQGSANDDVLGCRAG